MKKLLINLAFSVAALTTVSFAQDNTSSIGQMPRSCPGKDLFAELQKTKPNVAKDILAKAAEKKNSGPLLWEITPPNGAKPSFLLGTLHVTDEGINALPDGLKKKVRSSKVLALELKDTINKYALSAQMMGKKEEIQLPEGKNLLDMVPDELEEKMLSHPALALAPKEFVNKLQPWVVGIMVGRPECEYLRYQTKFMLDQSIAFQAQLSNIPIVGLEKPEEQSGVLSSLTEEEEIQMLIEALNPKISSEDQYATMIEAYRQQRIEAVMPLMEHIDGRQELKPLQDKLMQALLGKRNVNMADRAAPLIEKGQAFIAVGSLHLAGDDGVVALLQKKGYKLKPVAKLN